MTSLTQPTGEGRVALTIAGRNELGTAQQEATARYLCANLPAAALIELAATHGGLRIREVLAAGIERALAGGEPEPLYVVWRHEGDAGWKPLTEPMPRPPAGDKAKRWHNEDAMQGNERPYLVLPVGETPGGAL